MKPPRKKLEALYHKLLQRKRSSSLFVLLCHNVARVTEWFFGTKEASVGSP
ncbi:hypothetical protein [Gracilimonas amylolytica]|uniref:hypothetical protein n=1 Tax=Gracilimonas amylolytica TaxID=1749045 RepID=UPI001E4916A8|nr:hypothetical protein [Gracilimonas amylolytica]